MHMDDESPAIFTFQPNRIASRQRSRRDPCVYCGQPATTRDHVIPANLYVPEDAERLQLQTVAACSDCNGTKAKYDGPLRDFLVADVDASQHEKAAALLPTVERAVQRRQTRMFDRFYEGRSYPLFDREGRFSGMGWEMPVDDLDHVEAVNWITRGMHWVILGERADGESVKSTLIDRYRRHDFMFESAIRGGHQGFFQQGDQYACTYARGADGRVYWHHVFFDTVLFVTRTWRPGAEL